MKVLNNFKAISKAVRRLIRQCDSFRFAVAWASVNFDAFKSLRNNRDKIQQGIVGTHFYQTHPEFLREFAGDENFRVVKDTSELFHPKIYLFESGAKWQCIVGSPNFTKAAFTSNDEFAVLISDEDEGAKDALRDIKDTLDSYWEKSEPLVGEWVEGYAEIWQRKKEARRQLEGSYSKKRRSKAPLRIKMFTIPWHRFFAKVSSERFFRDRLAVLDAARDAFAHYIHLARIPDGLRHCVGGFDRQKGIDWGLFGWMSAEPRFKDAVRDGEKLSLALDCIPVDGEITRTHFEEYVAGFKEATGTKGIGTGIRLLTMKRPDVFLCISEGNREGAMEDFGMPRSTNLDSYWETIVEPTMDSAWWKASEPQNELERKVWQGRAAFLDALYYKPKAT
jgi:HKD family nuclease